MKKSRRLFSLVMALSLMAVLVPIAGAQGPVGTWASGIACVNLTSNVADIALEFFAEGSGTSTLVFPDTIPANGSKNYYSPSSFGGGLGGAFTGSVVVSSSEPISCNVNTQTTGNGTEGAPYRIGSSAGFEAGTGVMYAPQVMRNLAGAWSSYIAVQNTDTVPVTATVTFRNSAGDAIPGATQASSIPAGSNKVFYQSNNAGLADGFIGAATITASGGGSIASTVAFYNNGASSSNSQFHSYNAFNAGGDTLYVPRAVRRYFGYNSGLSIQNIGGAPVNAITVTLTFNGTPYTFVRSTPLAAGAAWAVYLPNVAELNPVDGLSMSNRFGGGVITADPGSNIVAIVNEDNRGAAADNNGAAVPAERIGQGSTYNAVASGSPSNDVFFAQIARHAGGVFSGGFQILNVTGNATTCTLTYGNSGVVESNVPLAANASIARFAPSVAGLPDGYNSSVTASCGQNVVGIANMAVNVNSGKLGDSLLTGNGLNQ